MQSIFVFARVPFGGWTSRYWSTILVYPFLAAMIGTGRAEDWLQFRGPDASGLALASDPPVEFSAEGKQNIAWKVDMPGRSAGGAIVVGDQVIATSSQGLDQRRIYVTSINAKTGERRWQQVFVARGRPFSHPFSSNAAPTPASDGKRVYAFYSSNDLVCIDLQGQLVWYRSLASEFPKAGNDTGMSSSPLVVDGVVIVQVECQGDSFVAGLDATHGELLWRINRPRKANWNSPSPFTRADGSKLVVFTSGEDITGVVARTGNVAFQYNKGGGKISSTLGWKDRLFVSANGLTALGLPANGDTLEKLWDNNKLEPGNSSPVVVGDAVVLVKGGVLSVGNIGDGSLRFKLRLPDAGTIYATPVVCRDRLYIFSDKGKCFVVKIGESDGEVIATNELGDTILGSPAVSGDALFLRGDRTLWKIAKN